MLVQLGMLCTDEEMSNVGFSLVNLSFFVYFYQGFFLFRSRHGRTLRFSRHCHHAHMICFQKASLLGRARRDSIRIVILPRFHPRKNIG